MSIEIIEDTLPTLSANSLTEPFFTFQNIRFYVSWHLLGLLLILSLLFYFLSDTAGNALALDTGSLLFVAYLLIWTEIGS
jgi:hypothetical protein